MKNKIIEILNKYSENYHDCNIVIDEKFELIADEIELAYASLIVDRLLDIEVDEIINKLKEED